MTSNMRNYYYKLSYSSKYVEKSYQTYIQQTLTNNSYRLFKHTRQDDYNLYNLNIPAVYREQVHH